MLAITPETLIYLRNVQASSDEKLRRKLAAERSLTKPRQLNKDRHEQLVDRIAGILKTGTSSQFEFEAASRHGIRASLCIEGWKWSDADAAAAAVVSAALHRFGAVRPSWHQGQPEWTQDGFAPIERTRCLNCGGRFSLEESQRQRKLYCSRSCATAVKAKRARASGERVSWAEFYAGLAAKKEKSLVQREQDCENCGEAFVDLNYIKRRFCSRTCAGAAHRRPLITCTCARCGTPFETRRATKKFCSKACIDLAHAEALRLPKQKCAQCSNDYQPTRRGTLFCCNQCRADARRVIVDKPCSHCGESFTRTGAAGKRVKYCSPRCSNAASGKAHKKDRPELTCPQCRSIFRPLFPSDKRTFCSVKCRAIAGAGRNFMAKIGICR